MKKVMIFMLMITMFPTVLLAQAQLSEDYGTELEITTDYEFPEFDRFGEEHLHLVKVNPIWSPDGKWIAFTDYSRLWIVSVEGGNARMMFEQVYEHEIRNSVIGSQIPISFSADGQEILFSAWCFDENRGSEIEITENSASFSEPAYDIMAVNINTGESRVVVRNGWFGDLSHDGRYLCYSNYDWRVNVEDEETDYHRVLKMLDLETGDSWYLTDETGNMYTNPMFSPDDSYIICQFNEKVPPYTTKYLRIPFEGGEPEPYTFYDGSAIGEYITYGLDMSRDGDWTLYISQDNTITIEDKVPKYDEDGNVIGYYEFEHGVTRQCVYNNITGDNYYLLPPNPNITTFMGEFSPDGSKYCYVLRDDYYRDRIYRIFVKDFEPSTLEKIVTITDVELEKPSDFVLLKNYPNPFNPSTTIEFSIPESGFVELVIYDITGQRIRELLAGIMSPGIHSVFWDGCDDKGTAVSSGVYISNIRMGEKIESHRMMLVK